MIDNKKLEIKNAIQISKPKVVVFNAIVNPEEMSQYFISKGSGKMEQGKKIVWKFSDYDQEVEIQVTSIIENDTITYQWDVEGNTHLVNITLKENKDRNTIVQVLETGGEMNEAGVRWLHSNAAGWANFLDCLKAYLEFGINLRATAFQNIN